MNKITKLFFVLITISCFISCKDDSSAELNTSLFAGLEQINNKTADQNFNISLLLDLSDRIDPTKYPNPAMEFYERDAGYISTIAEAFESHLISKKMIQMDDRIQLFFAPEPLNPEINNLSKKLKFNLNRGNVSIQKLEELKENYKNLPIKIYEQAIKDDHYIGSDTWHFLKDKASAYCIESGYRNILIIFTDGYVYHKDNLRKEGNKSTYLTPEFIRRAGLNSKNWKTKYSDSHYGFIPATEDLGGLEVLVLGINPDSKNDYEDDVIKQYWNDWMKDMKVKRFQIYNADLPSNMKKVIDEFINHSS